MEVRHLELHYSLRHNAAFERVTAKVRAVDDVSFSLAEHETLGVVGESGCGKTSLARCLVRLATPTGGSVHFRGQDITRAGHRDLRGMRREVQMVFQDPEASLNPRKRVGQIIGAGLRLRGARGKGVGTQVAELMARVGLDVGQLNRYPHEFSGGQRQRIGIARALAVRPSLLIMDEPVSALDVSVQAQIINLLDDLKDDSGLSYIFVAHDLTVVRHVSDRIAVMYLGKIVELSLAEELYSKPVHPYTAALLSAIPIPDRARARSRGRQRLLVRGEVTLGAQLPPGCRFHPRCPSATDVCRQVEPPLVAYPGGHLAACHHPLNLASSELAAASLSPSSPLGAGTELPRG
jgi:oligopeptide/dipeptide ABC transporter ATP-binding protein